MLKKQYRIVSFLSVGGVFSVLAPACSSSMGDASSPEGGTSSGTGDAASDDSSADAMRAACSVGPAHLDRDHFPFDPTAFNEKKDHDCLPRCDYNRGKDNFGLYRMDALPSGACSVEAETCNMGVMQYCCDGAAMGPHIFFKCQCTMGQWACGIVAQTGGGCGC